eukprot:TRINITY_DN13274_c1_g1_i1.p1 TRINITY_DN13274_c1_g1~~TRINITY_DN13274_c1_g1_i1.p1  ORF type:complete len:301 (-),score=74.27 TRINITY_DN13274_c1_g1_i1:179-997(-)
MTSRRFLGLLLALPATLADDAVLNQDIEEAGLKAEQLRGLHAHLDLNRDGKVSLQEVIQFSREMGRRIAMKDVNAILEEVDTNKDGQLSLDEHLNDIHNQAEGGDTEEIKLMEAKKIVETQKFRAADMDENQALSLEEVASLFYPETHEGVLDVSVAETLRTKDQNGDGVLDVKEFWEFGAGDSEEEQLSEEEREDFRKLDLDGSGTLDHNELKQWESGIFHVNSAMQKLIEMVDKDGDMHATVEEFTADPAGIAASDAQYHLMEWAEHHEL